MKRQSKLLISMITVFTVILMLAVCGCKKGISPTAPAPTASPTAEPTPVPFTMAEKTKILNLIFDSMPEVCELEGSRLMFVWNVYDYDAEADSNSTVTHIVVYDLSNDSVVIEKTLDGQFNIAKTDVLALYDVANNSYCFLDDNFEVAQTVDTPFSAGIMSPDLMHYYYADANNFLIDYNCTDGTSRKIEVGGNLPVDSVVSFFGDALLVRIRTSPYVNGMVNALIDPESGNLTALSENVLEAAAAENSRFISINFNREKELMQVTFGESFENGEKKLTQIDAHSLGHEFLEYYYIAGSDYCVGMTQDDPEGEAALVEHFLIGLDESGNPQYCKLDDLDLGIAPTDGFYLKELGLVAVTGYSDGGRVALINPEKLEFTPCTDVTTATQEWTVDRSIIEDYLTQLEGTPLSAEYTDVLAHAKAIEQKYGVRILLSTQCDDTLSDGKADLSTTFGDREVNKLESFLVMIEDSLALFPDGMFEAFRNPDRPLESGILFALAGKINDLPNAIGLSDTSMGFYRIILDCDYASVSGTVCHELWHQIEQRMDDLLERASFPEDEWAKLNPEGFTYFDSYEYLLQSAIDHNYYGKHDGGVYFIDEYSHTFSKEDRARIMEYVMCGDDWESILACPGIKAKYDSMVDKVAEILSFNIGK